MDLWWWYDENIKSNSDWRLWINCYLKLLYRPDRPESTFSKLHLLASKASNGQKSIQNFRWLETMANGTIYMNENHRQITDTYSNSHHKKRLSHFPNRKLPSMPYRSSPVARRWKFLSAENELQVICHLLRAIQFSSLHWYANHNRISSLVVHLSRFHRRMCRRSTLKVFRMWVNCILI